MIMPLTVNDPEFDQAVRKVDGLVMVDVCATSCGGCRLIAPRIDQLAAENAGKAAIVKVTVDEYADPTIQYEVRHTPPVNFFAAVKRWTSGRRCPSASRHPAGLTAAINWAAWRRLANRSRTELPYPMCHRK